MLGTGFYFCPCSWGPTGGSQQPTSLRGSSHHQEGPWGPPRLPQSRAALRGGLGRQGSAGAQGREGRVVGAAVASTPSSQPALWQRQKSSDTGDTFPPSLHGMTVGDGGGGKGLSGGTRPGSISKISVRLEPAPSTPRWCQDTRSHEPRTRDTA